METTNEILICDCHSPEHQIIISYLNTDDNLAFAHIHLAKRNFWYRLKYGIKYIFGYRSRYGAFAEFIFNPEDAEKLQGLVDYLKSLQ